MPAVPQTQTQTVTEFGGLNHTHNVPQGQWYDCENLTSRDMPLLTNMTEFAPSDSYSYEGNVKAIKFYDDNYSVVVTDDNGNWKLQKYYPSTDGIKVDTLKGNLEHSDNIQILRTGAKVYVMPYKLWFNINDNDVKSFEYNESYNNSDIKFRFCYQKTEQNDEEFSWESYDIATVWSMLGAQSKTIYPNIPQAKKTEFQRNNRGYDPVNVYATDTELNYKTERYWVSREDYALHKYLPNTNPPVSLTVTKPDIAIFLSDRWELSGVEVGDIIRLKINGVSTDSNRFKYIADSNITGGDVPIFRKNGNFIAKSYMEQIPTDKDWLNEQVRVKGVWVRPETETGPYNTIIVVPYSASLVKVLKKYELMLNDCGASNDGSFLLPNEISISRDVPILDHYIESDNRIWGVNNETNEIKCCELGNFQNWDYYEGLVGDPYTATCGTPGKFNATGKIDNTLFFFKDNVIHQLYGTKPSNYTITTINGIEGISEGYDKSLVTCRGKLYYNTNQGSIMSFNGSTVTDISNVFGRDADRDITKMGIGVAVGDQIYWYFNNNDNPIFYYYDLKTGIWNKKSVPTDFQGNKLSIDHIFSSETTNRLGVINNTIESNSRVFALITEQVPKSAEGIVYYSNWFAETGDIGLALPERKYVSKIGFCFELEKGSTFKVQIQYDNDKVWRPLHTFTSSKLGNYNVPMLIQRCDHFRLRLSGTGKFTLYKFYYNIEQGSDL